MPNSNLQELFIGYVLYNCGTGLMRHRTVLLLLPPAGGIAICRVCWLVRSCVREHVLGPNIL